MATRREARFKQCRRFGVNVYGHPKALKRVKKDQRQKKMSEYGTQLLEKQKLRAYYNVSLSAITIKRRSRKALRAKICSNCWNAVWITLYIA